MAAADYSSLDFHPVVATWFRECFQAPSPPQSRGWPAIASGRHTLIMAPTGSGKTLAAFLWSIDQLFRRSLREDPQTFARNRRGVHTLYVSPLKALNNDIQRNLKGPLQAIYSEARRQSLAPEDIRVAVRTGDTTAHARRAMLRQPPHVLITTPESLYLLLTTAGGREIFRHLSYLIIDEIHALCANKRGVHLSLSLERLMPLCRHEPVRIGLSATQKPLARIAGYLGGYRWSGKNRNPVARPVAIIDCGQRKSMDLQVITPVAAFEDLPDASVWQPVCRKLYELIQSHRTTLIFAGMRAQTEKIARRLNDLHRQISGDTDAELALAHHGSMSRESRQEVEARLKTARIPAVVATASLELGIDIGSIDLVIQLEAPRSVTGGLQRVGRSGHLLGARSKGRIMVLYPADLDDAVALAKGMQAADIETTRIPQNALDVLAQQITAETSVQPWSYEGLYRLIRQSYCYRRLPAAAFDAVLEMLAGKYAHGPLRSLAPRLTWDRTNQQLIGRRGSRLLAALNAGTIPDRGYFGVFIQNSSVRVGEVEEEFVFESRVGEVFFLGNSEWRIEQIGPDRVVVSPVCAIQPKAPFWKGGVLYRDADTSRAIGRLRRRLLSEIEAGRSDRWLTAGGLVDSATADNLIRYLVRQRERGGAVPTDRQLLGEWAADDGGQPLFVLHAPYGARVTGAWAIAVAAALEDSLGMQIQYSYDDDGFLLRLPETSAPPPIAELLESPASRLEAWLRRALPHTAVFMAQFRHNAARALILPRSRPGRRIPLWLQRLRAADLLQAMQSNADFPVMVETYRECLQDIFDLASLKRISTDIAGGAIRIRYWEGSGPSPMAAGMVFKFISTYLYEEDRHRQPQNRSGIGSAVLDELLEEGRVPAIIPRTLVSRAEGRWQRLAADYRAGNMEELYDIIARQGPISAAELARRSRSDPSDWISALAAAGRISAQPADAAASAEPHWHAPEEPAQPTDPGEDALELPRHIQRFLSLHGPVSTHRIATALRTSDAAVGTALAALQERGEVARGRFIQGEAEQQWCDRYNLQQLYRQAVALRRHAAGPAGQEVYSRFSIQWHGLDQSDITVTDILRRYRGLHLPVGFLECEILRSRTDRECPAALTRALNDLTQQIVSGKVIVTASCPGRSRRPHLSFWRRGEGAQFAGSGGAEADPAGFKPEATAAWKFLRQNGASYFRDLKWGCRLTAGKLQTGLRELALRGVVSCENYPSFLQLLSAAPLQPAPDADMGPSPHSRVKQRHRREALRRNIAARAAFSEGRWFLIASAAVMGEPMPAEHRARCQARLLLERYGVLVKGGCRREQRPADWYPIFQQLKRLEWQGEIRRGYFVAGLSGVQFARPEALEMLERLSADGGTSADALWLSTADPAMPLLDLSVAQPDGRPLKITRAPTSHLAFAGPQPVAYGENFFERLFIAPGLPDDTTLALGRRLGGFLQLPAHLRLRQRIEIRQINTEAAALSPWAGHLIACGFEREGSQLTLWPSAQ